MRASNNPPPPKGPRDRLASTHSLLMERGFVLVLEVRRRVEDEDDGEDDGEDEGGEYVGVRSRNTVTDRIKPRDFEQ